MNMKGMIKYSTICFQRRSSVATAKPEQIHFHLDLSIIMSLHTALLYELWMLDFCTMCLKYSTFLPKWGRKTYEGDEGN